MGRSLSFASAAYDGRPIKTRFRYGSAPERLSHAIYHNSLAHYAKGTLSPWNKFHRAPTICRHTVSGTFNSPYRGAFHLSLTLLFTIGHGGVLSLGRWASHVHTEFHGIRTIHKVLQI